MTQVALANAVSPEADGVTHVAIPACRPWGEIGRAVLFHVFAAVLAVGTVVIYGFTLAEVGRTLGRSLVPPPRSFVFMTIVLMQIALIWMAVARARTLGGGDSVLGLASGPIPPSRLFHCIVVAEIAFIVLGIAWLRASPTFEQQMLAWTDRQLLLAIRTGSVWVVGYAVNVVILAPLYEELVFRGWLWTALRRSWGAGSTALVTSALWLLLHAPQGLAKMLLLMPMALILSVVRERTGSVRATIVVHALNNARAVLLPLMGIWYS